MVGGQSTSRCSVRLLERSYFAALDGKKQNLDNGMGVGHEGRNHEGSEGLMTSNWTMRKISRAIM